MAEEFSTRHYLREVKLPFCPGCGGYTVINCFLRAVHELGHRDLSNFVFCSGIGCAAWIPSPHFKTDSIHTTHGRSIPVATGVKLIRPDLNVVVFGGDGDLVGIGLSHLIHAARRNLDITVVMVNNMVYGMTGGQVAPTTPHRAKTTTTPYGNFERPIDATRLITVAGASYTARWTTAHMNELKEALKEGLKTEGLAFVEAVSQCPTSFGRRIGLKTASDMIRWFKENSVPLQETDKMSPEELEGKIVVGEFVHRRLPTLGENIHKMIREAKQSA
ncbi:2-oxoacid:ferredoxin oxidoreductase subunit beta [Candidatus Bathyarchaeota archaeon]|nr:2-oxoacid:ferredoxin oxidoreductase subunit beta [Candidatus Bathyarchaeota archaeon]NIR15267.1 2-oxoacid:ferredoxin oxidoreductase subunit beta [Desulfobacterales bacterium]NIU81214.1 2-oxoacid:ferredoxin oxidoreductase subunit beta [Candidatus Bathyarchaeota archaeon]NIV68366.1 2-oxoacid:ferredoxin oxidoreductase subunit beta [Candidatus Bathyarchaeota archaeon]NIW16321.1 2-oxoacid:ferredoxin oxidoreductase subunit beta [Candidatus Bathyarchaeota archaeon]